jgi:hypothetical protein
MRIKKVSQTTATQAQVVNNENNSQLNAYSCDYVNNKVKDVYSTDEVKTNKIWIDGKPIYRKTYTGDLSQGTIQHGLTNVTFVGPIIAYFYNENSGNTMNIPSVRPAYADYQIGVYVSGTQIVLERASGAQGYYMKCYITLEYTKNTD